MVVLDTHVWLWWLHAPEKLSPAADQRIAQELKTGFLAVSAISVWEIAVKVQLGKLTISGDLRHWYELASSYPATVIESLTPLDAIASTQLPGNFHKDPADRIIIALARRHCADLITCDSKILAYEYVSTVW
jgi:PIN domain nuclease of toxin-antitoxin system